MVNKTESLLEKKYDITPTPLTISTDSADLSKGYRYSRLCSDCHGENLGGKLFFEDASLGHLYSSNLTSGKGGIGLSYSDEDWVRAIRHGVNPDGRGLLIMPSHEYFYMGEEDLAAVIAYLKTVPPVDNENNGYQFSQFTKVLMAVSAFGTIVSAEGLDHSKPFDPIPEVGESAEYGEYLVNVGGCRTCHGAELIGGKSPDPGSPPVPDISSSGNLANWTSEQFRNTLLTGQTPEGKQLDILFMPWKAYSGLNETEMAAIYNYLKNM